LLTEFEDKVYFLTIYIAEAHPQDKWPIGQHVCVMDHKTVEDRIEIAKRFISETEWRLPTVVDSISNGFMDSFKAHPERFFAIVDSKLQFKAYPTEAYYPVSDVRDWLLKYFAENPQPQSN